MVPCFPIRCPPTVSVGHRIHTFYAHTSPRLTFRDLQNCLEQVCPARQKLEYASSVHTGAEGLVLRQVVSGIATPVLEYRVPSNMQEIGDDAEDMKVMRVDSADSWDELLTHMYW